MISNYIYIYQFTKSLWIKVIFISCTSIISILNTYSRTMLFYYTPNWSLFNYVYIERHFVQPNFFKSFLYQAWKVGKDEHILVQKVHNFGLNFKMHKHLLPWRVYVKVIFIKEWTYQVLLEFVTQAKKLCTGQFCTERKCTLSWCKIYQVFKLYF